MRGVVNRQVRHPHRAARRGPIWRPLLTARVGVEFRSSDGQCVTKDGMLVLARKRHPRNPVRTPPAPGLEWIAEEVGLVGTELPVDEEVVSNSSGKITRRIVARKAPTS